MEEINNIYEAEVTEVNELVPIEEEFEEAGMSTGMAMAIGGLVTAGLIVIGKKAVDGGKKLWAKHKAKKASEPSDEDVIEAECEAAEEIPEEA